MGTQMQNALAMAYVQRNLNYWRKSLRYWRSSKASVHNINYAADMIRYFRKERREFVVSLAKEAE